MAGEKPRRVDEGDVWKALRRGCFAMALALCGTHAQADDSIARTAQSTKCLEYDQMRAKGTEAPLASVCDSVSPDLGGFRPKMAEAGWMFQAGNLSTLTYDVLHPSNSVPQSYVGQRPTYNQTTLAILTYDLSRIGFGQNAQLTVSGAWAEASYLGAGVRSAYFSGLSIQQEFLNRQVRVLYGFTTPSNDFYGSYLGTSIASSALGPASSMFYEVGVPSIKPAPTFELRLYTPDLRFYNHFAVTRSMSPQGFQTDTDQNTIGLTINGVKGARALFMDELGYRVEAKPNQRTLWVRAGALYNTSDYLDYSVGRPTHGNSGFYFAFTKQFTQPDSFYAYRGIYTDIKVDIADKSKNPFSRDITATLYSLGPFASRPYDMVSLGYTHQWISKDVQQYVLEATGAQAIQGSNTVSLSYAFHVMRGVYWTNSVSYTTQPVLAPSHPAALLLSSGMTITF
ncbi:MAG: carbohydrate porin [Pseudomonadota bacterium]|jgi:porin|uniref:carbohydrate porin n=1 Tax=Burkholderiaceae TaxID=119060 RepID=UPI0014857BD1|nr:carbohydrate porin [Burkholderia sp. 4M9327F10]